MSVILRLGAVNTETPYSRLVSDGTDYDPPVDMSPVAEELYLSPPQTYPGCFGLPYQDHNYGAPPPPTPPQTPPPPPAVKEPLDIKEEIVVTSDTSVATQQEPLLPDPPAEDVDDPTRCICDFVHDDGYMIQCDKCSVWQHIVCMGLDRDSIPDTYLCELCHPRPVDRARAREFQIRKREFLKNLLITTHDSSTDTDPEEVNNRLKAYGLDPSAKNAKSKQKMKMKKRKERSLSKSSIKKLKTKEIIKEKENTNKDINKRNKLLIKDFSSRTAQVKKEKLTKKIEKMRSERISKEMREDKFSSDDLKEDEKIINTISPISAPVIQDENAQNPWDLISNSFNEWEQSYEVAKYNQYTTYVQEYLNSTYINGHHNDIADLVTDGLRVQRCHIKELKNKRKGLQSTCAIPDGQPIIEVIGKVMTRQQYDKDNFGQRQLSPFVFFYGKVFDLDLVIDASDYGNDARFIRRSCQANAVVRHVVAGGQAHFITVATREILEDTEITIPFDYDYKKWNFCVECACLRNNCPVGRYQKKRLRFAKLQIQNPKKIVKSDKNLSPKCEVKSPIRSPTKSPIKTVSQSPEPLQTENHSPEATLEAVPVEPATPSPTKMVRRSQVNRQTSNNASTQASSGRLRSLRVPSQPDTTETVADPVTKPEPTNLRSSEVDPLTSPESKENNANDKQEQPQEKKKLTREERKMEAIMKAFEKMEKRNARKQSVDQAKPKDEKEKKLIKKEPEKQPLEQEEECAPVEPKEEPITEIPEVQCEPQEPLPPTESIVPEEVPEVKEEVKEEIKLEVKEEEIPQMIKPEMRQKAVPKGKKAKKTANRRRTRNSSGAAASSVLEPPPVDTLEESSNSSTPITSCPSTPVPVPVPVPVQGQEEANSASTPFKFLKTKRHLMNEWLIEKSCDVKPIIRPEPLEVAIQEEESMYVTCLPSPRNSMDRLRRNSQSCGSRDKHSQSVESTGSAKKRWLRQAMGEGSSDSGLASPGQAAGGMSPNPQTAMPSPGGSPPTDFVTPLKKRRLARESLSKDSISSESPVQTPTPSATVTATSYFSQMHEDCMEKLDIFKLKNGLTSFFSPVKTPTEEPIDNNEKNSQVALCSSEVPNDSLGMVDNMESNKVELPSPDKHVNHVLETSGEHSSKQEEEEEKDGVSSCAEIDCSVSYNTGTLPVPSREDQQISNTDIRSSSDVEEDREVCDEQNLVCDGAKSANSEPDSSDCAGICSETPMEVECDSGSAELEEVAVEVAVEVDSTESSEPLPKVLDTTDSEQSEVVEASNIEISSQNDQCDSCNSEHLESVTEMTEKCSGSSLAEKLCTSSSSHTSASSVTLEVVNSTVDVSDSSKHCVDRLSVVDSSTDKNIKDVNQQTDIVTDSTASVSCRPVPDASGLDSVLGVSGQEIVSGSSRCVSGLEQVSGSIRSVSGLEQVSGSFRSVSGLEQVSGSIRSVSGLEQVSGSIRCVSGLEQVSGSSRRRSVSTSESETGLINSTIETVSHIGLDSIGATSTNITESLLTSSHLSMETPSVPNRHLRFLTDCQLNTEMVVDSTTQYVPPMLTGSLVNSSGLASVVSYDSDSMDVTSGSDFGFNGGLDENRKSDDSQSGYPDNLSSKGSGEAFTPKEKKKVSLQEYLKRKKDKPSAPVVSSTSGNKTVSSSSTVTKSPLRLTTSITLDKLPPLPSLPSLPMFEKTERKEFKSSSDLLSPIFNRKEKQEEVRKPMSLSERLRQEFGLDDSTDTDTDTENKTDQRNGDNEDETDVPPPPPPPPPQGQGLRSQLKMNQVANGNALPSLMSLKTFHQPLIKSSDPAPVTQVPHPSMAPPGYSSNMKPPMGSTPTMIPSPGKSQTNSMPPSLMNLLSNVKSPAQLQNDLTAQLNALKAQISKVQQSLPISSSTNLGNTTTADQMPVSVNGTEANQAKPQVFDYGHQSSANFMRQNSYPSCSSSKNHFHGFNKKSSPSLSHGKSSPGYNKLASGFSKHSPSAGSHSQTSNHSYNSHHSNMSPPGWNQIPTNSHKQLSSNSSANPRKLFTKQTSHKYS